jgi:hypothetical protein
VLPESCLRSRSAGGAAAAKEAKKNMAAVFIVRDAEKLLVKMKLKNYNNMSICFNSIYGD